MTTTTPRPGPPPTTASPPDGPEAPPGWRATLTDLGAGRLVPACTAVGSVVAAGIAFGRVFDFSSIPVPLIIATVVGVAGGLGARLLLASGATPPDGGAGLGGDTERAVRPGDPGPARLTGDADPAGPLAAPGTPATSALGAAVSVIVATLLAAVLVDAASAQPGAGGLGSAISKGIGGLFGGWSRILTTSVPVPPTADRLPVMAGVVALAVALAAIAASRAHPGLGALVPAGVVLLVALALGVHGPGSVVAVSAAPAILAGAYLLIVSRPADVGVAWIPPARTAAAVITGAVVVVVALAVGSSWPLATSRAPVDLRSKLSPPVNLGSTPNPLDLVPQRIGEANTVMFSARVDQPWLNSPTDWRLVSLDVFDGAGWTTDARAVRAGTVLDVPSGEAASRLGPSSTQKVTVNGLTGPWVPTTGVPTGVQPADLAYDPATSILVAGSSVANRTFTLTSLLSSPTLSQLDSAGLTVSTANAVLTQVPSCFPTGLSRLAVQATAGIGRPDQQAAALEAALADKNHFADDPAATPGSSCGRLTAFAAAKEGTAEQFATAYVLMARTVGLPARLAVGFLPGAIDPASGTTTVHGSDATVWPEVDFAGIGWVAFNPVPAATNNAGGGAGAAPSTTVDKAQNGLNKVRGTVANSPASTAATGRHGPGTGPGGTGRHSSTPWWYAIPVVIVAAVVALFAGRLLARQRRRARRRNPALAPPKRITGAWAEVLDAMAPFDASVSALTPSEVTVGAGHAASAAESPVRALGALVDLSVYAGAGDDQTAAQAWEMSDAAVTALRQAIPAGLRVRYLAMGGPRRGEGNRRRDGSLKRERARR